MKRYLPYIIVLCFVVASVFAFDGGLGSWEFPIRADSATYADTAIHSITTVAATRSESLYMCDGITAKTGCDFLLAVADTFGWLFGDSVNVHHGVFDIHINTDSIYTVHLVCNETGLFNGWVDADSVHGNHIVSDNQIVGDSVYADHGVFVVHVNTDSIYSVHLVNTTSGLFQGWVDTDSLHGNHIVSDNQVVGDSVYADHGVFNINVNSDSIYAEHLVINTAIEGDILINGNVTSDTIFGVFGSAGNCYDIYADTIFGCSPVVFATPVRIDSTLYVFGDSGDSAIVIEDNIALTELYYPIVIKEQTDTIASYMFRRKNVLFSGVQDNTFGIWYNPDRILVTEPNFGIGWENHYNDVGNARHWMEFYHSIGWEDDNSLRPIVWSADRDTTDKYVYVALVGSKVEIKDWDELTATKAQFMIIQNRRMQLKQSSAGGSYDLNAISIHNAETTGSNFAGIDLRADEFDLIYFLDENGVLIGYIGADVQNDIIRMVGSDVQIFQDLDVDVDLNVDGSAVIDGSTTTDSIYTEHLVVNTAIEGDVLFNGNVTADTFFGVHGAVGNCQVIYAESLYSCSRLYVEAETTSFNGLAIVDSLKAETSIWWYCKYMDAINLASGGSGATQTFPDANTVGGYQMNAVDEYLYFNAGVCNNWDGVSDIEVKVRFEVNIDNTLGADTDTVEFDILCYYKGNEETANKTQTATKRIEVGKSPRYKMFTSTILIDYNPGGGNDIDKGDVFAIRLNLDTANSDVTDVIVNFVRFKSKSRVPQPLAY